jgi:hypothetical protein
MFGIRRSSLFCCAALGLLAAVVTSHPAAAQNNEEKCILGCTISEGYCMKSAHSSSIRQLCVRMVEFCRKNCTAQAK